MKLNDISNTCINVNNIDYINSTCIHDKYILIPIHGNMLRFTYINQQDLENDYNAIRKILAGE